MKCKTEEWLMVHREAHRLGLRTTSTMMIGVGEATGALDTMLSKIADFYEEEVDTAVAGLLTLLEPIMIAILGVVVSGIVIAMYLPIFDLISKLT